jgi:hypothetical protein
LGLFDEVAGCFVSEKNSVAADPKTWALRFGAPRSNTLPISLCRLRNAAASTPAETCDVRVEPTVRPQHADRMLINERMARILAGLILDWAPFQAKLGSHVVRASDSQKVVLGKEPANSPLSDFPGAVFDLIPVAVSVHASSGVFNARIVRSEPIQKLAEQNKFWVANINGRGKNSEKFSQMFDAELKRLEPAFRKQNAESKVAHSILGRPQRAFAKYRLGPWQKTELEFGLKGGGIYSNAEGSKVLSQFYQTEFSLHKGKWLNVWFDGQMYVNKYTVGVRVANDDAESQVSQSEAQLSGYRASFGPGVRFFSSSDHTFALFPSVGYAMLQWKVRESSSDSAAFNSSNFSKAGFLYGAVFQYDSPERWPVNTRARALVAMEPGAIVYGVKSDFSFRLPQGAAFLLQATGAHVGWVVPFVHASQIRLVGESASSESGADVGLSFLDVVLGLGLKLEWR